VHRFRLIADGPLAVRFNAAHLLSVQLLLKCRGYNKKWEKKRKKSQKEKDKGRINTCVRILEKVQQKRGGGKN